MAKEIGDRPSIDRVLEHQFLSNVATNQEIMQKWDDDVSAYCIENIFDN